MKFNKDTIHAFTRPLVTKGYNWEWNAKKAVDSTYIIIWKPKDNQPIQLELQDIISGKIHQEMFN